MRKLFLLAALVYACVSVSGQAPVASVTFHFRNISSGEVNMSFPIDHNYFWGNRKKLLIAPDGTCSQPIMATETGFIWVTYKNETARVFTQAGDHIVIDVDTLSKNTFHFTGNNAEGQATLSSADYPGYTSQIIPIFQKDSTV